MRDGKLLLLYPFEMFEVGMQKDLGRLPKVLHRLMNIETRIFCFCFREKKPKVAGVEIKSFSASPHFLGVEGMRFMHAVRTIGKEFGHTMFFGTSFRNYFLMRRYKKVNPAGKIYWKLDIDQEYLALWRGKNWANKMLVKRPMNNRMLKWADVVSVETKSCYERLCESVDQKERQKVMYLPNGFDERQIQGMDLGTEKKPVILFVGRLDDPVKNAVSILRGLSQIDFKGEFRFIGPAEEDGKFLSEYRALCAGTKGFEDKVHWVGEIAGREELYRQYAETMGIVLASSRESFGIVLGEAAYFDNFIVSTRVGASMDITNDGKLGAIVEANDWEEIMKQIQACFENAKETIDRGRAQGSYYRENFLYRNLIQENKHMQEFFYGKK
jgi:glycosyltransferase involved in cell wall biosynthesis